MKSIIADLQMTISARYLMTQLAILDNLGFSYQQSYSALEFNRKHLSDMSARIPIDAIVPIFKAAEKTLNNPLIGLEVGFLFRIGGFAKTGSIYSYCDNLIQVIELQNQYQRLAIDVADITYGTENPDRHYMQLKSYYDDHIKYRHITDMIMGAYGTAYRWLTWGTRGNIKAVHLPYPAPQNAELYEQVFQCEAVFNAPVAALEFTAEMMTTPLTTRDPEKRIILMAQLDNMLESSTAHLSFKAAIDAAMKAALQKGIVTNAIIASRLGRTERQLRNDMKASNLSYRTLLDSVRQETFIEQYRNGESFASIAQSLAYNDQAAFNRAFRRWYGISPGQWALKTSKSEYSA